MHRIRRSAFSSRRLTSTLAVGILLASAPASVAAQDIPTRLADSTFWRMVSEFSEPGGFFRSDNFVSNEGAFQYVIPGMLSTIKPGGVYLGVGPDQNFTYIVAFQPKIAFIVDIRRQNMVQHLMYKALMEMADDRATFLSRLFSRPRPPGLDTSATAQMLFESFVALTLDSLLYHQNLAAIRGRLTATHGFALTPEDSAALDYVYGAFAAAGPAITYVFGQGGRGLGSFGWPSYADLMVETDGQGLNRSYLATETNYRSLRELQERNLIVPVVGNFGGPKALRAVGEYLKQRSASVSLFYVSNVEQYLFQDVDLWSRFYENVSTLPVDQNAAFVRSVSNRGMVMSQNPNSRSAQLISSIAETVKLFGEGRLTSYTQVIAMSRY